MRRAALALVQAWLTLDFFGAARRAGGAGSSLTTTVFGQSFLAFIAAWMLADDRTGVTAYAAANLSLSTVLVGLGVVATPQREARRRADRLLVATAPIPTATLPLARAAHATLSLTIVTIGAALPPAILLHATAGAHWAATPLYVLAAIVCAALLAGVLELLVRIAERSGGPLRGALVAGALRALLLAGAFVGFALGLPALDGDVSALPGGAAAALSWPPYHAARIVAAPGSAAGLGSLLVLLAALGALAALTLSAPADRFDERRGRGRGGPGPCQRLAERIAGRGPLRAATAYTATMLLRSPAFRSRVLPLLGLPLAMVALALADAGRDAREQAMLLGILLQFPAIYTPFLVAFLPFVEGGSAGALFATAPRRDPRIARLGAVLALTAQIHLPALAVATLAILVTGALPPGPALALGGASLALAVLATALAVRHLDRQPFTSEREAAPAIDTGQLVAGSVVLALVGAGFAAVSDTPAALAGGPLAGLAALGVLARTAARLRADLQAPAAATPAPTAP